MEGEGIPAGWEVSAYLAEGLSVSSQDGVVALTAHDPNDLRLIQTVKVEENTAYVFSADISAENIIGGRGATLSIDNYSLDGSYIYSRNILGSSDWTTVELTFQTGEGQTAVIAALRLGGYSELSTGTARFRNVQLVPAEEGVYAQPLTGGGTAPQQKNSDEMDEARKIQLKSYLHLFVVISVMIGAVLLFGVYRNREHIGGVQVAPQNTWKYFIMIVATGLVLRSILSSITGGHDSDMSCWIGWGNYIAQYGPSTFYTAPGHEWYDYPPGYMLVLGFISKMLAVFQVPAGSKAMTFAYIFPAYIADVGTALLLMHCARKNGFSEGWCLLIGGLTVFNPAAVVLSGAWGQIDSILTFFLLLSFVSLLEGRRIPGGIYYGLAIMIKWQALIYGPVLAAAYLLRLRSRRDILETIGGVISALLVIFVISLPFKGEQGVFWIVGRFLNAAGGYDYASVEAYNFLALCGGNWAPASGTLLFGISYRAFGTVAILLSVVLSVYMQWEDAKPALAGVPHAELSPSVLYLSAAFCMYAIFTFGHYMHERYVFPVMLLLMMAFILTHNDKFLFCSMLLSVVLFLNEMTAMYVVSNVAMAVVRGGREHQAVVSLCSGAETISFVLFAHTVISYVFYDLRKGGAARA